MGLHNCFGAHGSATVAAAAATGCCCSWLLLQQQLYPLQGLLAAPLRHMLLVAGLRCSGRGPKARHPAPMGFASSVFLAAYELCTSCIHIVRVCMAVYVQAVYGLFYIVLD
jgi:hypothetical protein